MGGATNGAGVRRSQNENAPPMQRCIQCVPHHCGGRHASPSALRPYRNTLPITSHNQVWAKSVKSRVVSTLLKAGHCELVVAHPKQGGVEQRRQEIDWPALKVECLTDLYNAVLQDIGHASQLLHRIGQLAGPCIE